MQENELFVELDEEEGICTVWGLGEVFAPLGTLIRLQGEGTALMGIVSSVSERVLVLEDVRTL